MNSNPTIDQVISALEAVMRVPIESLERLVQEAHESTAKQKDGPPQQFPVSRQALRMFWHFRCNLEAVNIFAEGHAHG
jgi:hypothetical protein